MKHQERRTFTKEEIAKIGRLLAETDLKLKEIADRMECSTVAVAELNRQLNIRHYYYKRRSKLNTRSFLAKAG